MLKEMSPWILAAVAPVLLMEGHKADQLIGECGVCKIWKAQRRDEERAQWRQGLGDPEKERADMSMRGK